MKHFALMALLGLVSTMVLADGPAVPAKAQTCFACHGQGGHSTNGMFPILAGQYTNYIEQALHEYKDGERKNAIMGAQAAGLSEDDIRELALYFSAQPSTLHTPTELGPLQ